MADSGRCDENSVTHFGVDWDNVVLLLAKALKQENADVFLEVYDNLIPSNLPFKEIEHLKETARRIAELPEKEFDILMAGSVTDYQPQVVEQHSCNPPKAQTVSCHMAATDGTVGISAGVDGKTTVPPETAVKTALVLKTPSESSMHFDGNVIEAKSSLQLKHAANNKGVCGQNNVISQEKKDDVTVKKHGVFSNQDSKIKNEARHSNVDIGASISFGLERNATSSVRDKPKLAEKNAVVNINSHQLLSAKKKSGDSTQGSKPSDSSSSPHTIDKLMNRAVDIVDDSEYPESSTCPKPEYIDNQTVDHTDAVALNYVSGSSDFSCHTLGNHGIVKPVEQEMQPVKLESNREQEGLCSSSNGKLLKNYGSTESPEVPTSIIGSMISSPEDEISPTASSTTEVRDDGGGGGAPGPEVPDEPTKKKRKRKKKKKGNAEADPGGTANSSDHESKVLTSPGTSGAEDSSKIMDPVPQPSPNLKQLHPNGPSEATSKTSALPTKNKKAENKNEKKQTSNSKKQVDSPVEDSKPVGKAVKDGLMSSVKPERPKSLDMSDKDDALRTTHESTSYKKPSNDKSVKLDGDRFAAKEDNASDNESESGNDAEKSSEDTSVKASKESSMDENFRDEDESNGNEWQTYGIKKSKRRALAAEDRYSFRPSPADNLRRSYYSGPFDPKLRKSSSEPSGMSKWMDVSDNRPVHRHASFSRHHNLREEFHSLSRKPDSIPADESVEKPPPPVSANSYAAKLKAKPPVPPNGSGRKSQESQPVVGDQQDSKIEDGKTISLDSGVTDCGELENPSVITPSEVKDNLETKSSTSSTTGELDSQTDLSDIPAKAYVSSAVSAATAAKSASLPRDMGRIPDAELPKLDNTSADNVVQYLDLQCSNDTYAARLKQSINKSATDTKTSSKVLSTKQETSKASDDVKPARTSKLESSHKAVSLDSAPPAPTVVPKKSSSANSKDKDSMRTVKSETSLNLTAEGMPVIQDNSFPFEAEPAESFDITFGSVKFCESDFELIDDVTQSKPQQKGKPDSKPVPQPSPVNIAENQTSARSPSPPANQVSCADLEKAWITKSPQNNDKSDNHHEGKTNLDNTSTVPSVPASLAAILASGNKNNTPHATVGENNNLKKKPLDRQQYWTARFNHSELADMLLKEWETLNFELTKQSSKVVVYEEE